MWVFGYDFIRAIATYDELRWNAAATGASFAGTTNGRGNDDLSPADHPHTPKPTPKRWIEAQQRSIWFWVPPVVNSTSTK